MGWSVYSNRSREYVVAQLVKTQDTDYSQRIVLAYEVSREGVLWRVVQETFKNDTSKATQTTSIYCDVFEAMGDGLGHKSLAESLHPYYYCCPLLFLDMACDEVCEAWRDNVKRFHLDQDISW